MTAALSPASNPPHWFRIGLAYSSASGTNQADVGLEASWMQLGALIDATQVVLTTDDVISTSDTKMLPLTRWFPQRFAGKIRIASQVDSVYGSGVIQYRYVAQTASVNVATPSSNFETFDLTPFTAASAGETSQDVSYLDGVLGDGGFWMRVGVIFYLSTAPLTNAILKATISVRN